jgi:hypothetical protein
LDNSNKKLSILAAIYSNKSKINEQNIETTTDTEGLIYPSTQSSRHHYPHRFRQWGSNPNYTALSSQKR